MRIVIVGAGAQGTIVADILGSRAVGFVDDDRAGTTVLGLEVFGTIADLSSIEHDAVVVAIGDNAARRRITDELVAAGENVVSAIHPFSSIASSATVGEGCIVSAGAIVLPRAVIGRGVILNTKASIDHDSVVGDFVHVSVGVTIGARVRIGDETLIAIGSSVVTEVHIGARCTVGAGSVVLRELPDDVVAWGTPAKAIDRR